MINNDVLRSIRYMLDLGDARVVEIIQLADPSAQLTREEVHSHLAREGEDGFVPLGNRTLARFLDGLILHYRGPDQAGGSRPPDTHVGNNVVLKKLRVAFQLKDVDMHQVFEAAGFPLTKPEMTALFRQAGHKHYRQCGDQILRNFLKGLTLRFRGAE